MMLKTYTGIGSRDTPHKIQVIMFKIAQWLSLKGYVLRSGGAKGADESFEKGCDSVRGLKEIYLPWSNFENNKSGLIVSDKKAFEIAKKYHPYWGNLSIGGKKLQARNSHQVLGKDLESPSLFVLCYTKNGKSGGGTGQAIRIAKDYGLPIFDFGAYKDIDVIRDKFKLFCEECGII